MSTIHSQNLPKALNPQRLRNLPAVARSSGLAPLALALSLALAATGCTTSTLLPAPAQASAAQPLRQSSPSGPYPSAITAEAAGGQASIDVLGPAYTALPPVAPSQSRIVLYRPSDTRAGATSIFVDDRYHASLVPGAWSQLCYRTGAAELATRQMQAASSPARDRYDAISAITLAPGAVQYLRVDTSGRYPVLRPVASAQAQQEIAGTREQLHTVSRAGLACMDSAAPAPMIAPAPAPAPAPAYTLAADTLFAFDRSNRAAMTEAGTRAIDMLLARLSQDYSRIERVHLVGHADPLGSAQRNERLAIERALTVREHILRTGNVAAPITVEGRGSREPVVSGCGNAATPQAIACNRPNRRVTVEVIGVRR